MSSIFDLFKQIESKPSAPQLPLTHLVVGLGNPGPEYIPTRHNAGFDVLDHYSEKSGVRLQKAQFDALTAENVIGGVRVLLMKPMTFMNASGIAVSKAAAFYHIPPENIVVISDDVTLDVGRIRIRRSGSAGGHNGLKSIIEQLGTDRFPRIRLGVGAKPEGWDLADWVLAKIPEEQKPLLKTAADHALEALPMVLRGEFDQARGLYNGR